MKGFVKDPDARLDYAFDWSPWLNGDEISTSNWYADSGGIDIVNGSDSVDDTNTITRIFIEGGTPGENYALKNTITTIGGRTDERTIEIRVRQR